MIYFDCFWIHYNKNIVLIKQREMWFLNWCEKFLWKIYRVDLCERGIFKVYGSRKYVHFSIVRWRFWRGIGVHYLCMLASSFFLSFSFHCCWLECWKFYFSSSFVQFFWTFFSSSSSVKYLLYTNNLTIHVCMLNVHNINWCLDSIVNFCLSFRW